MIPVNDSSLRRPLIVAVDSKETDLAVVDKELTKRYGEDYYIHAIADPNVALTLLEETESPVAMVLADPWMAPLSGPDFLMRVRDAFPEAKIHFAFNEDYVWKT